MAFRSFAKEGRKKDQHRERCQEMVGLCVFRLEVFLAVTTNTAQTAVLLNTEGDILSDLNSFLVPRVGI